MNIIKCIMALMPVFCSAIDLTLIGNVKAGDGLSKVGLNIVSSISEDISINLIEMSGLDHALPEDFAKRLSGDPTIGKVSIFTHPLCSLSTNYSSHVPSESLIKIAYSMLETTKIPDSWVRILNENFDVVVVPDDYLVKVYVESGVTIPIFMLPIPMNLEPYFDETKHSYNPHKPFVFGDASLNKNPLQLIDAFNLAFGNNPDVQLHLRAGFQFVDSQTIQNKINELGLQNVYFEFGYLNQSQFIEKLKTFDCYVNISRGEGFSFIHREALALGIPVISTDNTALSTICNTGFVKSIKCDKLGPPNAVYGIIFNEDVGYQFDCKTKNVAKAMLDVHQNYKKFVKLARDGRKWVEKYNIHNHSLRKKYTNLVKPDKLFLGDKNVITEDFIMTSSKELYNKYLQIKN